MHAEDSKTLERFQKILDEAKRAKDPIHDKWRKWEKAYRGENRPKPNRKNRKDHHVYPPWIFQQIETIKPRLLYPEPEFKYRPLEPRDQENTRVLDKVVKYQLDQCGYVEDQPSFIHDAAVKGFAVGKTFWDYEECVLRRRRKRSVKDIITGAEPFEEILAPIRNWAAIAYVDPFSVFPDPAATNDRNMRYMIHEVWLTHSELREKVKLGRYDAAAVEKAIEESSDSPDTARPGESEQEAEARRQGRVCVHEYWTRKRLMVVANKQHILRDGDNPYDHKRIPFACFSTQPVNNSLYGISEVEGIYDTQNHLWEMRNMRVTATKMALKTMLVLDPTIKGVQNIGMQAGGKIYASPGQRVEQLRIDPNAVPGLEEEQMALGDMQTITGASPFLAGADPSAMGVNQETATGASILQEEANKRMAAKKMQLQIFTGKLATMMAQLNYQFMEPGYAVRITGADGDEWETIEPHEVPLVLDIRPVGLNESISKTHERNSKLEFLNVLMPLNGVPVGNNRKVSIAAALEDVAKSYGEEPERHFIEVSPEEQAAHAMQAAGLDPSAMMGMGEPSMLEEPAPEDVGMLNELGA